MSRSRWKPRLLNFGWPSDDHAQHSPPRAPKRHGRKRLTPHSIDSEVSDMPTFTDAPTAPGTPGDLSEVLSSGAGISRDACCQHPDAMVIEPLDELLPSRLRALNSALEDDSDVMDVAPMRPRRISANPLQRSSVPDAEAAFGTALQEISVAITQTSDSSSQTKDSVLDDPSTGTEDRTNSTKPDSIDNPRSEQKNSTSSSVAPTFEARVPIRIPKETSSDNICGKPALTGFEHTVRDGVRSANKASGPRLVSDKEDFKPPTPGNWSRQQADDQASEISSIHSPRKHTSGSKSSRTKGHRDRQTPSKTQRDHSSSHRQHRSSSKPRGEGSEGSKTKRSSHSGSRSRAPPPEQQDTKTRHRSGSHNQHQSGKSENEERGTHTRKTSDDVRGKPPQSDKTKHRSKKSSSSTQATVVRPTKLEVKGTNLPDVVATASVSKAPSEAAASGPDPGDPHADDVVIPLLDIDQDHLRTADVYGHKVSPVVLAQKRLCLTQILTHVFAQDHLYRGVVELANAGPASNWKASRARKMLRGPRGNRRKAGSASQPTSTPRPKRARPAVNKACEPEILAPTQPGVYYQPADTYTYLPAGASPSVVPAQPPMPPAADDHRSDAKMLALAKATRALQEHVKDMTEKTKTGCCMGKHSAKENLMQKQNNILNAPPSSDIQFVFDRNTGTTYAKGKLLGRGGFAKCFELTDLKTRKTYAGKIISKNRITKPHQREKIAREVELHRNLKNPHVVGFHSYFEDEDNVYIVLENCSRKSLVHVLKSRKTLTEPEVRYFLRHLVNGCKYIHSQKIVHRDLKLGNMLINEAMQVKIADFGLATRMEYEGEKKMTVCGTPNYIAPEVLEKKGHSYEADIWAIGCVMYAMLVGRPPFETSTLKETYMRITENKYSIPSSVSPSASALITKLLSPHPHQRPSLDKILQDDFFSAGYLPKSLSTSCCDHPPKFPLSSFSSNNRPKSYAAPVSPGEAMIKITSSLAQLKAQKRAASPSPVRTVSSGRSTETVHTEPVQSCRSHVPREANRRSASTPNVSAPEPQHRRPSPTTKAPPPVGSPFRLYQMLTTCLEQMPADSDPSPVADVQPLWVTKWVDYSNKYGFGFQLSDRSVGVLFNDTTRMLLSPGGKTIQYNDLSNKVYTFSADSAPREYRKKCTLLLYFAEYMDEHLIHGGDILKAGAEIEEPTAIFMKKWFRTGKAIVMYLNNGTLQVNFFEDHTKVILSADQQDYILTYINSSRQAVNYRLLQLRHFGCHPRVAERLHYARAMLEGIINIQGEAV